MYLKCQAQMFFQYFLFSCISGQNIPIDWCGQDKLLCPGDVSGEGVDQCLDKDLPCGTHCHSYWNIDKTYCKMDNSCVKVGTGEHVQCRNQDQGCGEDQHYCDSSGGICQSNSETCTDFCGSDYYGEIEYYSLYVDEDDNVTSKSCRCITPGYSYCKYTYKCQRSDDICSDPCGYNDDEGGDKFYCAASDSCIPVTEKCDGSCLNQDYDCSNQYKRYWCQEEQKCKTTFETCGGKCLRPCYSSEEYYYCKANNKCVSEYMKCEDGCPQDQVYCAETGKCRRRDEPCYKECKVRFKNIKKSYQRHNYCEPTQSCIPFFRPCNGTCLDYQGINNETTQPQPNVFPNVPMVPCPNDNQICYVEEFPPSISIGSLQKAEEMCKKAKLGCSDDEYICNGQCNSLTKPCFGDSSLSTRKNCLKKFAGVFYNLRWCESTNACIPPEVPCDGKCMKKKPRMAFCQEEGSCVNIKNTCAGQCLEGRVKCENEDKCIHKSAVGDGVVHCSDGSDEDIIRNDESVNMNENNLILQGQ